MLHKALYVRIALSARFALYEGIARKRRISRFHGHHEWWSHGKYALHLSRGFHGLSLLALSLWFARSCCSFHLLSETGIPHTSGMTIGDFDLGSDFIPVDLYSK